MQKHACFSDVFKGFHPLQGHYRLLYLLLFKENQLVKIDTRGCEQTVVMGSSQRRGPEQATCVHTAGFEDVHRGVIALFPNLILKPH